MNFISTAARWESQQPLPALDTIAVYLFIKVHGDGKHITNSWRDLALLGIRKWVHKVRNCVCQTDDRVLSSSILTSVHKCMDGSVSHIINKALFNWVSGKATQPTLPPTTPRASLQFPCMQWIIHWTTKAPLEPLSMTCLDWRVV